MATNPKVSICIPTFNRSRFLMTTLSTILGQTFTDFELIISDDGSSDNTPELIKGIKDSRLRYNRNSSNLGLYENWNHCISIAHGEYIAIYHDHDLYEPSIIEESVNVLESNKNIGFVFTGIRFIDDQENVIRSVVEKKWDGLISGQKLARHMATKWYSMIAAPTVLARKDAYDHVGLYNPKLGFGADLDMWIRLLLAYDTYYISKPMASLRIRTDESPVSVNYSWKDIEGKIYMHLLNIDRVFKNNLLRYTWGKTIWYFKKDRERLKFLAWALIKKKKHLLDEGNEIIANKTNLITRVIASILFNPAGNILLKIGLPVYHLSSQIRLFYFQKFLRKKIN